MKTTELKGMNIQEIITKFKDENQLEDFDFSYEIIREAKKGFLGIGNKKAIVRFTYHDISEEIKNYLREFSIYAQVSIGKIEVKKSEKYIHVELNDISEPGFFIGKDGKFLSNLQYVLNQSFTMKDVRRRTILLDVEAYKERQEHFLIRKIQKLADQAIQTNTNVTLDPMVASQRRIVHKAIQDNKQIKTMTIGEDPTKRIVLCPVKFVNKQIKKPLKTIKTHKSFRNDMYNNW